MKNIEAAIKLLLDRINTRKQFVAGTFGAFEGTAGNLYMQQRDFNAALTKWRESRDISGLIQVTASMHAYGNLNDTEFEQLMSTLSEVEQ
jgi:hypothetical protein